MLVFYFWRIFKIYYFFNYRRDTGDIPGDNRGAAGIDSALWVHIARNWFWAKVKRKESSKTPAVLGLERERMLKVYL